MTQGQSKLIIRDASGQRTEYVLGGGETIVGCDATSDIRVVSERSLGPRHILLVPRAEDCWVSAQATAPLRDEAGAIVDGRFVPWGTRLVLGSVQFELQSLVIAGQTGQDPISGNPRTSSADTGRESGTSNGRVNPILLMLALCTIAFVGFSFLSGQAPAAEILPPEEVQLFAAATDCKSGNAAHRAEAAEETADAKSQRAVFDAQDGIAAVALFEEASSCYQKAGQPAPAKRCAQAAETLRASMLIDYKRMRLRLSRALAAEDNEVARQQVRRLQELLRHQQDSATSHALRRLALRLSRKN